MDEGTLGKEPRTAVAFDWLPLPASLRLGGGQGLGRAGPGWGGKDLIIMISDWTQAAIHG